MQSKAIDGKGKVEGEKKKRMKKNNDHNKIM